MSESAEGGQANPYATTEDHLKYMPGVALEWANIFVEYAQKYQHFEKSMEIFWKSPRVVRIAILRPESMIRLIKEQHALDQKNSGKEPIEPFGESIWYVSLAEWNKPIDKSIRIGDLEHAAKCYKDGMSPMQAIQDIHVNSEDGYEKNDVPFEIGSPYEPLATLLIAAVLVGCYLAISWALYFL